MSYVNNWKLSNGATVTIGATTYEDAQSIGLPNNEMELVEITNVGSTRKEFTTGIYNSDPIELTVPLGAPPAFGTAAVSIFLPLANKTISFTGICQGYAMEPAEQGKPAAMKIKVQPTTAPAIS